MPRIAATLALLLISACFEDAPPTDDASDNDSSGTNTDEPDNSTGAMLNIPEECSDIGVVECDVYIARYVECIDEKLPEENKETSLAALVTSCEAWVEAAQDPSMVGDLADACVTAYDAVKASCGFE